MVLATHDIDFAYAWADDVCLLNAGTLVFQGSVDNFPAVLPQLPELGMEPPWILELYQFLGKAGLIDMTASPPRSKAAFMKLLNYFGESE